MSTFVSSYDVSVAAADAAELVAAGEPATRVWRFAIAQANTIYDDRAARIGAVAASRMFDVEPPRTGDEGIDAAFAALVEYLADRDGWTPPAWVLDSDRTAHTDWYVVPYESLRRFAFAESPEPFRRRRLFVSADAFSHA